MKSIELNETSLAIAEAGHGALLLCVHGFPLDHSMWAAQLEGLSDEFHVVAPDLRGFGASAQLKHDTLLMERLADDLHEMLERMSIKQPIVFCGLSMGGYVAWQFWRRYPDRLAGLVLCDTRSAADSSQVAQGRQYLADRVLREGTQSTSQEMVQKLFAPTSLEHRRPFVERTLSVMNSTAPETVAAASRGMATRPDVTAWLPRIDCPTLVLCGAEDVITPPDEMQALAEALPNSQFHTIPDAGHLAPLENPQPVNDRMRRFLRTIRA